jgi:hypothetical protein
VDFPLTLKVTPLGALDLTSSSPATVSYGMCRDVCNGFTGGSVVEVLGDELQEGQQDDPRMVQSRWTYVVGRLCKIRERGNRHLDGRIASDVYGYLSEKVVELVWYVMFTEASCAMLSLQKSNEKGPGRLVPGSRLLIGQSLW